MNPVKVGTRGSPLARWQAEWVCRLLGELGLRTELIFIKTSGDKHQKGPLANQGGKGLFVKELETALREQSIDLAVHSLKDVPTVLDPLFTLATFLPRADPRDCLITCGVKKTLDALTPNMIVGSCSLRRVAQLLHHKPGLAVEPLRGNVETRLEKVRNGTLGATFLAKAGLDRLGIQDSKLIHPLDITEMLPAAGQGIVAIEVLVEQKGRLPLDQLDDQASRYAAAAERCVVHHLGGTCVSPIAAHAQITDGTLQLSGFVGDASGRVYLREEITGLVSDHLGLARQLADRMISLGAIEILSSNQSTMSELQ